MLNTFIKLLMLLAQVAIALWFCVKYGFTAIITIIAMVACGLIYISLE